MYPTAIPITASVSLISMRIDEAYDAQVQRLLHPCQCALRLRSGTGRHLMGILTCLELDCQHFFVSALSVSLARRAL
eukprot:6173377-Pleurochrysis_carterae.AAC.1